MATDGKTKPAGSGSSVRIGVGYTRLPAKPEPLPANVCERNAPTRLAGVLAGFGQDWPELERAMEIEPTGSALSSL